MNFNEYTELALRTLSNPANNGDYSIELTPETSNAISKIIECNNIIDNFKRAVFYRNVKPKSPVKIPLNLEGKQLYDFTHAMCGISTESSELLQNLFKKELDVINIKEEIGDLMWYLAVLTNTLSIDFEEILEMNIAKLKKRYPTGFEETNAINRNISEEQTVFEKEKEESSVEQN